MPLPTPAPARAFLPGHANPLSRLLTLRRMEVIAQALILTLAVAWLRIPLAVLPMAAAIVVLALVNLLTRWRLKKEKPVSENELFAHLAFDTLVLGVLLYFAGGSANPFVSLFLLPPTLAAAMLPARHAWAMAGATLLAYTFLIFWSLPLPPPQRDLVALDDLLARAAGGLGGHAAHSSSFALHILGMWLNFVVSIGVVAYFLTRMAGALKARERELAAARESALDNERILSLGTLAAGAAHQLGTPLATMAVLLRELELRYAEDEELRGDLLLLRQQVERCKQTISEILASTRQERATSLRASPLDVYLRDLLDDWQVIRPRVTLRVQLHGPQPAPRIIAERTLAQALLNLLDNAADAQAASQAAICFAGHWDGDTCRIEILDHGPGLQAEVLQHSGELFFTTKADSGQTGGVGIGLFLSNATIQRFGGRVELFNREDGRRGACTRVTLPLAQLKAC